MSGPLEPSDERTGVAAPGIPVAVARGLAIAALLLGLGLLVRPDFFASALLQDALSSAAERRVDDSLTRNGVTFLALSGVKAVLASVEGSAVGIGFHFELGDLVQPAYDYLDFVWHAFLYAMTLLGLYKVVIETGILGLGLGVLGAGLLLFGAGHLFGPRLALLRSAGARLAAFGLAIGYLLPTALVASQLVAERYLEPLRVHHEERIESAREPLARASQRLRDVREKISVLDPGKSLATLQSEAQAIAGEVKAVIWERSESFVAYVLLLLLELLVLPFAGAWLAYRGAAWVFASAATAGGWAPARAA